MIISCRRDETSPSSRVPFPTRSESDAYEIGILRNQRGTLEQCSFQVEQVDELRRAVREIGPDYKKVREAADEGTYP